MRICVIGAGNAGCLTALHYGYYTDAEVELIYDPEQEPERVGQATITEGVPHMLWLTTGLNWYNNSIHATFKSGILYEGWGKKNDKVFHDFAMDRMALHFCPWEMQEHVLKSGYFKVTEGKKEPEDIDADYIFDCRGKPKDFKGYKKLDIPTNACILGKPNWDVSEAHWSRHVATPDGWTFIIPTKEDSPSRSGAVGYCYNSTITDKEEAEKNFLDLFDVEITKHLTYNNYVAEDPVIDNRIILNGNRLFFLEPLESTAVEGYCQWNRFVYDSIISNVYGFKTLRNKLDRYITSLQNFILWHYQFGSKYDTPFWNYAKTLTFNDPEFDKVLDSARMIKQRKDFTSLIVSEYGQWNQYAFHLWNKGMT